ncbi:MAG: hypothetical protein K0Q83_2223 [Deltaproteobacteria bacterium]|nr:hypothetical protein [Deltaproteobacteria bacterium]
MKGKPPVAVVGCHQRSCLPLLIKLALNFTNEYTAGSRPACEKRELVLKAESIDSVDKEKRIGRPESLDYDEWIFERVLLVSCFAICGKGGCSKEPIKHF